MRTHVMSPDLQGRVDGTISSHLLSGFPDQSSSRHDCDVILVPVSMFADFKFNPQLREINKPWVLLDYLEYEWSCDMGFSHIIGRNTRDFRWLSPAWWEFCDFARERPPALYLKRELLSRDETDSIKPIDWPCGLGEAPFEAAMQFDARPIEVFFSWGFSHPSRPLLHAAIFRGMTTHALGVIGHPGEYADYFKAACARTWAAFFSPWYSRRPISEIEWYQMRSKISVSLPGCGQKCFRHAEAPVGTIMALLEDELAWSYEWVDGRNCIRLDPAHVFDDLEEATKRPDLHRIYRGSQETIALYRTKPYVRDYLIPLIERALS